MFSTSTQQIGISMTSVGKSGFITSLYIILVPILGLLLKKKVPIKIWFCVGIVLIGLYLLCIKNSVKIEIGDIFLLLSAFGFAVQILIVDSISQDINTILLSIIQLSAVAILSLFPICIIEKPSISNTLDAMPYLLFAGVLSSGIAYTLQIVGQKYTTPVVASLIMSLESVFAAITGWLFLNEILSFNETIGCVLIFIAIIISQIEFKKRVNKNQLN
jgi:drug/metabolite transporter (DMT)-like permease